VGELYNEALVAIHGVWRRRWWGLAAAWAVGVLGWLIVSLIPNSYKSEATIYVQAQSLLPDKIGITPNQQKAGIETVRQTLISATNLEKVVRGTDLAQLVSSDAEVTGKAISLQKAITITSTQDNLYKITANASESGLSESQNAKLSKAMVQKLIDLFVDGNLRDGRVETGESLRFLDAQVQQRSQPNISPACRAADRSSNAWARCAANSRASNRTWWQRTAHWRP
jgi:polysaccharide biosynthesis transport protein